MDTSPSRQIGLLGANHDTGFAGTLRRKIWTLSPYERASRVAFASIMLGGLVIGLFCLMDAVGFSGKPFPGFLMNERLNPSNLGRPGWTGPREDLRYPDKILTANDRSLSSPADLEALLKQTPLGESITYKFERDGVVRTARVPTMLFTWTDLALTFGPPFAAGVLYLVIALVVYVLKPDTQVTWALVFSCVLIGMFHLLVFELSSTYRLIRLALCVNAFIPAAGLHLSLLFPERTRLADRMKCIQAIPYCLSAAVAGAALWLYPGPLFATVYGLIRVYTFISVGALLFSIFHAYFKSVSVLARQRAKVVLAGVGLAFPIPVFLNHVALTGNTPGALQVLSTFVPLCFLLFPASIAYAIARHNLFDVDVYLKRTVGYVMMTALVAGGYFSIQTVVRTAVLDPLFGTAAEQLYPLVFALLTVFAFDPLNRVVQRGVDRLFYRQGYDYKATVSSVSDALSAIADIRSFLNNVVKRIRDDMFVDRAGVIVLDDRRQTCDSVFVQDHAEPAEASSSPKDPCAVSDDPLLALLARERRLITKYDIAEDPAYGSVREACGRRLSELGASMALPLFYRNECAGMLTLGYKKSGHFYTREDVDLLQTLSSMTSTAIEHAREKGQRAVLMQLFSKHVSPQVAEVLWEQREQFLEGGRPRSQSLTVTAMFTDLQGFSTISEKQDPGALMKWLNAYMDMVTTTVMEHGGVVDDYFGDGVKINFGVPIPRVTQEDIGRDAVNAVACALAMEANMVVLNAAMTAQGYQPLRMRVGIYTGPVVAGSLGSAERMKYTTLGDTVNTAARLESFSKEVSVPQLESRPCRILIGESTRQYLGDRFRLEPVGEMELKGKHTKVQAYCVLG